MEGPRPALIVYDTQLPGQTVVRISQDGKLQGVLLGHGHGVVRTLGSDGYERHALGLEFVEMALQVLNDNIAVRTPLAVVKGDQETALLEEVLAGDLLAGCVLRRKAGNLSPALTALERSTDPKEFAMAASTSLAPSGLCVWKPLPMFSSAAVCSIVAAAFVQIGAKSN